MKCNIKLNLLFLFLLMIQISLGQDLTVKGIITDATGPIPGANVLVKGTTRGVSSDFDGSYSIKVKNGETLVFSFLGYKNVERVIENSMVLNIKMEEDVSSLKEVVVTGFQKIDRKLFTGSAATLKQEDIKLDGVAEVSRALQGQVAGVEIENVSGSFGAAPVVRIRGNNSINGINKPLWVVDNVVLEDAIELSNADLTTGNLETLLSSSTAGIGPGDIEKWEVLKDASATALYGARALNGVIVITTKRGKSGETSINYTSSLTTRNRPNYGQFNFLTSGDEMSVYQELYEKGWLQIPNAYTARNHGAFLNMFIQEYPWGAPGGPPNYAYLQRYANANTDWFKELFQDSFVYSHSFSISSGTEKSSYRASVSYLNDEGQTIADKAKNFTGILNADFNLSKNFKLGFQFRGNVRDQRVAASQDREFNALSGVFERNFDINPFNYALYTSRSITPRDENGNLQFFRRNWAPFNILHEIQHNFVDLDLIDISFQTDIDYKITKNLNFFTILQGRWYSSKAVQSVHENSNNAEAYRADNNLFRQNNIFLFRDPDNTNLDPYSVLPNGGFRKTTLNTLTNYFMRNSLNYNNTFKDVHNIDVLLGQEIRSSDRTEEFNDGWGYVFDKGGLVLSDPNFIRFLKARGQNYFRYEETRNRAWSSFVTAAYAYDYRYILNSTFNYSGDNRTGDSKAARYLSTFNFSGAWNIHEESFLKNANWLSTFKLKSTYGLSGSNPFDASAGLIVRGDSPLRPQLSEAEVALIIDQLENSELTFEKLYEWNFGLELGFFNNRLRIEAEYYSRKSKDLIGFISTNGVGGQSVKLGNIGELDRKGQELTLKTINVKTKNFNWSTNLNYSFSKAEITKWDAQDRIGDVVSRRGGNLLGYPSNALFSIPFAGLDKDGVPTFHDGKGGITQFLNMQERTDILKYVKYEGPTEPTFFGGFNNNFNYKNVSLNVGISYRGGNKIRLDDFYSSNSSVYNDFSSLPGDLVNRWTLPGDQAFTNIPSILDATKSASLNAAGLNPYDLYNKSDLRVADGDYVRLKNVSISYQFPSDLIQHTWLKSATFSLSANNLWLIYSDKRLNGIDPEFFQAGGVSLPLARTFTFTANFNF